MYNNTCIDNKKRGKNMSNLRNEIVMGKIFEDVNEMGLTECIGYLNDANISAVAKFTGQNIEEHVKEVLTEQFFQEISE